MKRGGDDGACGRRARRGLENQRKRTNRPSATGRRSTRHSCAWGERVVVVTCVHYSILFRDSCGFYAEHRREGQHDSQGRHMHHILRAL
jgi:hypothetical protein